LITIQKGCLLNGWKAKISDPIIRDKTNICKHPKPIYRLNVNKHKRPKGKVQSAIFEGYEEIYILNTDGDHTYWAENVKHHNCWDGYAKYCQYLGAGICSCTTSGYVKDIWTNRSYNGILDFFSEVTEMLPGDVAVFKETAGITPLSHIAIFDSDAGGGYGNFLGQNQGGYSGAFNVVKLPYSATYDTAFRPKALQEDTSASYYWDENASINVGDTVSSVSCAITGFSDAFNLVYVPDLGGYLPCSDVSEAADTKDGAQDDYLANTNAKIYLDPAIVTDIDIKNNLVQVNGYWVKASALKAKRYY
jgi:hypothetical protein